MYRKQAVCLVLISQSLIHIQQDINFICCFDHVFVTLEKRKRSYSLYAGACAHLQDSVHFLHFCRIIRHEVFMFIRLNLHLSQLNSTSISRSEKISFFLHQKDMFASSSWCKHFLFGLRRREKKNIERFLNAQFFCHWKRNLTQCQCVYCGQQWKRDGKKDGWFVFFSICVDNMAWLCNLKWKCSHLYTLEYFILFSQVTYTVALVREHW